MTKSHMRKSSSSFIMEIQIKLQLDITTTVRITKLKRMAIISVGGRLEKGIVVKARDQLTAFVNIL